ncbi:hypothetical protein HNP92_001751 [Methanococcus maripaludis]|uniref:Uncharacterized protein n=1 Tax=Methanococcus maripaludis TaxID=39152 RepID=A0A7J9S7K6_METMI|nr:hypothetical protein [Methanococcus maripaludis]MBB6402429.1 hypothetical protein [Methanococcus maripaludis]
MKEMKFIDSNTHPFLQEGTKYYETTYSRIKNNKIKLIDMLVLLDGNKLAEQDIYLDDLYDFPLSLDYLDNSSEIDLEFDENKYYNFSGHRLSFLRELDSIKDTEVKYSLSPLYDDSNMPTIKVSELIKEKYTLKDICEIGILGKDLQTLDLGLYEIGYALIDELEFKNLSQFGIQLSDLWLRVDVKFIRELNKRVGGLKGIYVAEEILNGKLQ